MACFSCGESLQLSVRQHLQKYKNDYFKNGNGWIFYKLKTDGEIMIINTKSFFDIIKPKQFTKKNIQNGADFAFIQEFGQTSDSNILGNNKK